MNTEIKTRYGTIKFKYIGREKSEPIDPPHNVYSFENVAFPDALKEVTLHRWVDLAGESCTAIYEGRFEWGWHYESEESRMLEYYLGTHKAYITRKTMEG